MARRRPKLPTDPRGRRGAGTARLKGKSWQARWSEDGERRTQGGFPTKDDALDFLRRRAQGATVAKVFADLGLTPAPKPKPKPVTQGTFAELIPRWLETRKSEERAGDRRTVDDDRRRWDRHLAPVLNHRTPAGIDAGFVANLITDLKAPPSGALDPQGEPKGAIGPATAQRVVHLLSSFYVWAMRYHGLPVNPCRDLDKDIRRKLRTTHDPRKVPFLKTKDDVARLFRALSPPINIAYALSALAGLRPGEAIALEWSAVDLDAGEINVTRQVRHGKVGVPKSGKARTVPIMPSLHDVLTAWRKANPTEDLVVPAMRYPGEAKRVRGQFLNWRTIADAIEASLKACKLKPMTFYEAGRHTFASQWVLAGNSIYRLKEIMGHSSVTTTERYAHLTSQLTDAELARADVKLAS